MQEAFLREGQGTGPGTERGGAAGFRFAETVDAGSANVIFDPFDPAYMEWKRAGGGRHCPTDNDRPGSGAGAPLPRSGAVAKSPDRPRG